MNAYESLKILVRKAKAYVAEQRRLRPQAHVLTRLPLKHGSAAPLIFEPVAQPGLKAVSHPAPPWASTLEDFRSQICGCLNCPLGATRKRFMFGSGNPKEKLVFFGLF